MAISKWTIFEYEYSIVEFILSFLVAFFLVYFILLGFVSSLSYSNALIASTIFGVIIGLIWTYSRAHKLFGL